MKKPNATPNDIERNAIIDNIIKAIRNLFRLKRTMQLKIKELEI